PDVTKPGHNQFVNTTPVSGFCANSPQHCAEGEFSIIVPGFQATKVFDSTTNDLDKHVFSYTRTGTESASTRRIQHAQIEKRISMLRTDTHLRLTGNNIASKTILYLSDRLTKQSQPFAGKISNNHAGGLCKTR
ncbi:hypothetical protein ACSHBT_004405, partial [Cronobacter sakazakii]